VGIVTKGHSDGQAQIRSFTVFIPTSVEAGWLDFAPALSTDFHIFLGCSVSIWTSRALVRTGYLSENFLRGRQVCGFRPVFLDGRGYSGIGCPSGRTRQEAAVGNSTESGCGFLLILLLDLGP
jgi:hypothetical protein